MKTIFTKTLLAVFTLAGIKSFSQTLAIYTPTNSGMTSKTVNRITIDKNDVKWLSTDSAGLVKFDNANWTTFNTSNSNIPSNVIKNIEVDKNNTLWMIPYAGYQPSGLASFDGTTWTHYTTSNSTLPSNNITSITIDTNGIKYIGTPNGLVKINGSNWTIYDSTDWNSSSNYILDCKVASLKNELWISNGSSTKVYDGSTWSNGALMTTIGFGISIIVDGFGNAGAYDWWSHENFYYNSDSGKVDTLCTTNQSSNPTPCFSSEMNTYNVRGFIDGSNAKFDANGKLWFTTVNLGNTSFGIDTLFMLNYSTKTFTKFYNPDLLARSTAITIDKNDIKWLATTKGLLKVHATVASIKDEATGASNFNIYPNPFSSSTTVSYTLNETGKVKVELYNILGDKIETLNEETQQAGDHLFTLSSDIIPGVYFIKLTTKDGISTKQIVRSN